MKKVIIGLLLSAVAVFATTFTLVVPQGPGAGTSVWAEIVGKELTKYLPGDKVEIKFIPGGRDIPGFNKWHNELRNDDTMIMVSHGGNGVSFLEEDVDYNYNEYDSIGMMNLDIISGRLKNSDKNKVSFGAGSGMTPEAFAMTLLFCGPNKTVDEYGKCFQEHVTWVKGMSGGERRLAFKRGELTGTRENPAAYKKHVESDENAELWFTHGILQLDGSHADDPNYPGYQLEILFKNKYGVYPSGEFYDAYKLSKSFRDALQKALWVRKDNPNRDKLIAALTQVATNPESVKAIEAKVGHYEWVIGEDGNKLVKKLMGMINEPALKNLVYFNKTYLGLDSIYKPQLVK